MFKKYYTYECIRDGRLCGSGVTAAWIFHSVEKAYKHTTSTLPSDAKQINFRRIK